MKVDIFNIDKFINANHCKEVTNSVFYNFDGTPTEDGLFSYSIFGFSDEERKNIFGYIDLKGHYLHPLLYILMSTKMGALGKVLSCEKWAVVSDKKIKIVSEDFEGAETGIDFIYDHFDEIDWSKSVEDSDDEESVDKTTRLKFLNVLKRDEAFVSKWLVLPPFYRGSSSANKSMGDSINKFYKELISKVKSASLGFSFDIFAASFKLRIQNILKNLYYSTIAPLSGKNLIAKKGTSDFELRGAGKTSMVRKHLLGKSIDWSASSVITAPENSGANTLEDKPIPWGSGEFPIATLVSLFHPFFASWCEEFLEKALKTLQNEKSEDIKRINVAQFSSNVIDVMLKRFIKDPNSRFDPIIFEYRNNENKKVEKELWMYEFESESDAMDFLDDRTSAKKYVKRSMTLMDLCYICAEDILTDKHVYVTRFPINNALSIYPSRIKTLTTAKTRKIWIVLPFFDVNGYENYPTPPNLAKRSMDAIPVDATYCGNAYLKAINGDYDGDMLFLKGVFSQEANAEAEKIIWSKVNMLKGDGNVSRGLALISKECVLGLYELTKEAP